MILNMELWGFVLIAGACSVYSPEGDARPSDTLELGFLKAESLFVALVDSNDTETEPEDD